MVDNLEERTQLREPPGGDGHGDAERPMYSHADRTSFAARIRVIILLAIICWAVLLAALAWIIS